MLYCLQVSVILCIQYSTSALRTRKRAVPSAIFIDFVHTVRHFRDAGLQKCCTVYKFSRFCGHSTTLSQCGSAEGGPAKVLYCLQVFANLDTQYSTFAMRIRRSALLSTSFHDFVHTVQHFRDMDSQKCCTVYKFCRLCAHSTTLWRCRSWRGFCCHF